MTNGPKKITPPSVDELRAAAAMQGGAPRVQPPKQEQPDGLFDPTRGNQPIPGVGGVGAAYASNHNVSGTKGLKPDTVEGLEALQREQKRVAEEAQERALAEEQASIDAQRQIADREAERQSQMGAMEAIQAALSDNPWMSPGVRQKQEETIDQMPNNNLSITRILMDRGKQMVPIADGLVATMQTLKASEDLLVKRMLREYVDQLEVYFDTMSDMLRLAIGVDAIGEIHFSPLVDPETNKASAKTIGQRLEQLLDLPTPVIAALAINYTWFDMRVKQLLVPSSLKNG